MNNINPSFIIAGFFAVSSLIVYLFFSRKISWVRLGGNRWVETIKNLSFFAAFFMAAAALGNFAFSKTVNITEYLFVFDITPSQMVEDYFYDGKPITRLEAAKQEFLRTLNFLPENSYVALGAMSGKESKIEVFLPLTEIRNRQVIREYLGLIDWWNAWDDGSSLSLLQKQTLITIKDWDKPMQIVFFSDGGGDPAVVDNSDKDQKELQQSLEKDARFLFVGVGGLKPLDVPKFDNNGKRSGCLLKNATECFTSALDDKVLVESAKAFGGSYLPLSQEKDIRSWLTNHTVSRPGVVKMHFEWLFGLLSLVLITIWIIL